PAGAEWIVSADADAVVLQHNPSRKQYKDMEYYPAYLPSMKDEIDLIKIYGAPTVAITVNTMKMNTNDAKLWAEDAEKEFSIPVVLPLEEGVDRLVSLFADLIKKNKS
ncbi:MAG: NAD-dependent epimerase/dehydratase family protein, partial [Cyclobacteriaceae bacterium]|nr:NAD-dependent epimerase/dehydratase family protein [Cyclobacteriaceae bacterium]